MAAEVVCLDAPPLVRDCVHAAYFAVTGREFALDELLKRSERVWNLTRTTAILRRGLSAKDDQLPERDFKDPVPAGKTVGAKLDRTSSPGCFRRTTGSEAGTLRAGRQRKSSTNWGLQRPRLGYMADQS